MQESPQEISGVCCESAVDMHRWFLVHGTFRQFLVLRHPKAFTAVKQADSPLDWQIKSSLLSDSFNLVSGLLTSESLVLWKVSEPQHRRTC